MSNINLPTNVKYKPTFQCQKRISLPMSQTYLPTNVKNVSPCQCHKRIYLPMSKTNLPTYPDQNRPFQKLKTFCALKKVNSDISEKWTLRVSRFASFAFILKIESAV